MKILNLEKSSKNWKIWFFDKILFFENCWIFIKCWKTRKPEFFLKFQKLKKVQKTGKFDFLIKFDFLLIVEISWIVEKQENFKNLKKFEIFTKLHNPTESNCRKLTKVWRLSFRINLILRHLPTNLLRLNTQNGSYTNYNGLNQNYLRVMWPIAHLHP